MRILFVRQDAILRLSLRPLLYTDMSLSEPASVQFLAPTLNPHGESHQYCSAARCPQAELPSSASRRHVFVRLSLHQQLEILVLSRSHSEKISHVSYLWGGCAVLDRDVVVVGHHVPPVSHLLFRASGAIVGLAAASSM